MFCQRCGNEVPDASSFCGSCGSDLGATTPLAAIRELAQQSEIDLVKDALKGDYEILGELGRGGMAVVYHAREIMLDREVALKVLPFSLAFDEEFVERFQREARTSARLEHPHIIPVYRVGKTDNVIYFSMKFLRGTSLADAIEAKGKLNPTEIRKLLIEAASALGYAHSHDIVHRDIKPDNIMFKENGQSVVCDFGIAKAASGTKLTGTGMAIGTPYYMSPEQARAQPLDGRSDLYSLGVLAYQCLVGSVPFDGDDSFAIGYKHIMEELPEPELAGMEQRALFEVIKKMMAKDPDDRFQEAEDLVMILSDGGPTAQAIPIIQSAPAKGGPAIIGTAGDKTTPLVAVPGLDELPTGASPVPTAPQPTPLTPMPRESMELGVPKKKSKAPVLVGALVVLLGGGGGGAYYVTQVMGGAGSDTPAASTDANSAGPEAQTPTEIAAVVGDSNATDTSGDSLTSGDVTDTTGTPPSAEEPSSPVVTTERLTLVGLHAQARVFLDDTRVTGAIHNLEPGRYDLRVERTGYEQFDTRIQIVLGEPVNQRVATGQIQVVSTPQPVDRTPPPRNPTPAGPVNQCVEFIPDTYNIDGSCLDEYPRLDPRASPMVTIPADVTTGSVQLAIQVKADGTAGSVFPQGESDNPQLMIAAIRYAQSLTYVAATKDGRPVVAWLQQLFFGQH